MSSNRRQFIKSSGLGLASMGMLNQPENSFTKFLKDDIDQRRGIELAIATICLDGFGDEYFENAFELAPKIGIKNIEFNVWYPRTITLSGIESIRDRCYEKGLKPISLQGSSFGGNLVKDVSHKLWLMEQARSLGCRRVKFTGAKRGEAGGLEAVIAILKELAPAAEEMDVLILVENHANNNIENATDYDQIFNAIPSPHVGMCLDMGHFDGAGVNNMEIIERFHKRITHIDLKDTIEFGRYKTVNFGEGITNFHQIITKMIDYGYFGYLVIEQAPPLQPDQLLADMTRAKDIFSKYEK